MSIVRFTEEQLCAHKARLAVSIERVAGRAPSRPDAVALVLPYPVSSNLYWRSFVPKGHTRAIVTLSDAAKAYKAEVKSIAISSGVVEPMSGRVELMVKLYPARPQDWAKRARKDPIGWDDNVRSIDLDNCLKVTIDAIKGIVIKDDSWVRRIVAERMEPDGEGRLALEVRKIVSPVYQQSIL